jgi:uncharacterized protein (TIGR02145 family)
MKSRIIFLCVFFLIALIIKGQTVSNLRFEQSGKLIDVYYDLSGESNELFQINLYCSQESGKIWGTKLIYVSGDLGDNIKPGTNKKITWDVLKEKKKLVGEVKFKVEATPMSNCRSFTVTHNAGDVAPVNKTVTYSVVETDLTGNKQCWITQNLGADMQATSATDASEASAGWYWQFNRKQGYKHDLTTRTPNTTWISSIEEQSNWLPVNDPCTLLLESGWRLPTYTEWKNADVSDGWGNYNETYASVLKLHAAGTLYYSDGLLISLGSYGYYWSSSQQNFFLGRYLYIKSSDSDVHFFLHKASGFSVRCLRD